MSNSVRCREIGAGDLDAIVELLTRGFHVDRSRDFWTKALARLTEREVPEGYPRYGVLLESGDGPVGVLLLIFATIGKAGATPVRCNVSSWYVEPDFRAFGSLLLSRALRRFRATYINVTPARHTWPLLEAQGYRRYCKGVFLCIPLLRRPTKKTVVTVVNERARQEPGLLSFEPGLLVEHARWGCISLLCRLPEGTLPFVFVLRRKWKTIPVAVLVYSRGLDSFMKAAGVLGRFLARRGIFVLTIGADGPVAGLRGVFLDDRPKFFLGPDRPDVDNLAYTEVVLFGV